MSGTVNFSSINSSSTVSKGIYSMNFKVFQVQWDFLRPKTDQTHFNLFPAKQDDPRG